MSTLKVRNSYISTPLWEIIHLLKGQLFNGKLKDIKKQGTQNIRVTCPHHGNGKEANPDCDIYIGPSNDKVEYGTAKCFACGFKSNFVHFVAECFESSDTFAEDWLITNFADATVEVHEELKPLALTSERKEYLNENILDSFETFHPYMLKRKLTKEVCNKFELRYDPKTECLVFPVRDETGKLWMLTRRSVIDKRFIIDANKEKPVYLLYYLKQNNITEAYVCESQFNALTCWTHGLPGIALFGTGADHQYDILNKSGIRVFNLLFDGDSAGDNGIEKFKKNIRKDALVNVIRVPRGKDVNDLSYDEFETLITKGLNKLYIN